MVKEAKVVYIVLRGTGVDIPLPKTIDVKNYAVGLVNIHGFINIDWTRVESIPLCSNVCEASFVGNTLKPIILPVSLSF